MWHPRGSASSRLLLAAVVVALWATVPGRAAAPEVLGTRDLGPLETSAIISGRDGAYSTRVGGLSVWVYGDTALTSPGADGGQWRHNTMSWTHDLWTADNVSGFSDFVDAIGAPVSFIPLTADEIAINALHHGDNCHVPPCNWEYGFWPGAPLYDGERNRVLYTYAKMWLGTGAWNFETAGSGIAVGSPLAAPERPIVDPASSEPTLLFNGPAPVFINAVMARDEGGQRVAYFFDCSGGDGFTKPMHLARVPVASALDRSAWRFYAGGGTWSADVAAMATIFDGSDQLSVQFSPFLGQYLAVYVQPLTTHMVGRTADRPEGPWSDAFPLFETLPAVSGGMVYCGMSHPEFERDGGRYETISYVRDTGSFLSERRLVEVEFARRVAGDARDAGYEPALGVTLSDPTNKNQACMGNDSRTWKQMALAFGLPAPRGATITSAVVQLVSSGRNAGSYTPVVRAIAQDDLAPFAAGTQPSFTDAYPLTGASAAWTPENAPANATLSTPELRALVQEVVDRPGWAAGHTFGLVFPETRTAGNLRCFDDASGYPGKSALLRLGYYPGGAAVCLDASGGVDGLRATRAPLAGCGAGGSGPALEFAFGRVGALRVAAGQVDLGPVRCGGGASPTTRQVVRVADPDQPAGDAAFYLVRPAGATDFGTARLPDGSTPLRRAAMAACP